MAGLFAAGALAATSYIPAVSVVPLAAEDMLGSARWSGVPGALAIAGTALGTAWLTRIMARRSRRFGLQLGFAVAAGAAVLAALAVEITSFPLLLVAMVVLGAGFSSRHLSRYAAGDLYPATERGAAIGIVVWAGTIGSILGPLLLAPVQQAAIRLGASGLVGPYLLAALGTVLACLALGALLPPLHEPDGQILDELPTVRPSAALLDHFRRPAPLFAVASLMVGQFTMVVIMAMTPLHIRGAGEGLGAVGLVFSAHTLGMFALSPLTGRLADRWGRIPVIVAGQGMLVAAALMAATSPGDHLFTLSGALFLLGLGWNFGFVAASALLSESASHRLRLRVQGAADALAWSSAALANLCSGLLLAAAGYAALNLAGAALVLVPLALLLRHRRALAGSGAPAG